MKPNFALKLSNDGVEFLHRSAGGWVPVGTLSFASEDVAQGCAQLVAKARDLEPGGVRTKLVLPDSEVRYESVIAPGPTDEARRYQIEAEIERLTPYNIDELAYDWAVEEDSALVVICARETLLEAETFAEGYGFNPVSFVALPAAGQFVGEPFLGETSVARAYLPKGEKVQRDAEALRVIAAPRAEPAPAAPAPAKLAQPREPASPAAPVARPVTPPVAPAPARPVPPPAPPLATATPAPAPAARSASADKPAVPAMQDARAKVGDLVRRMGTRLRREQASAADKPVPAPQTPAAQATGTPAPVAPVAAPRAPIATRPQTGATSGAMAVPKPAAPGAVAKDAAARDTLSKGATDKAPLPPPPRPLAGPAAKAPAPVAEARADLTPRPVPGAPDVPPGGPAFASRRRPAPPQTGPAGPSLAASGPGPSKPAGDAPGGRIAVTKGRDGARSAAGALTARLARNVQGAMARLTARKSDADSPQRADTRRRASTVPDAIVPASRPPVNEQDKVREAEALTIFGARGMQRPQASMAGRGLMIAGAALLLLVAVAVWTLYFSPSPTQVADSGDSVQTTDLQTTQAAGAIAAPDQVATETPAPADTPQSADAAAPTPAGGDTTDPDAMLQSLVDQALNEALPTETLDQATQAMAAAPTDPADAAQTPDTVGTADAGAEATDTAQAQPDNAPSDTQVAAEAAPQAGTPASPQTGAPAATTAATTPEVSDTPQVAATETADQPLSLPTGFQVPPSAEVAFAPPPAPPPFGTQFTFDDRGLVAATPDGALTPSGVTVYARRPAVVPAPRPAGIPAATPAVTPAATPEPAAEAAPAPAQPVATAIENAVAEAVGTPPAPTAPAATALAPEVTYDDTPRADPALARFRPQPRSARVRALTAPQAPAAQPEPDPGTDQTLLDAPAEGTPTDTAALETPPPGGVSLAALRPQRRPSDFAAPADPTATGTPTADEIAALDLDGATPEAVTRSLIPGARPDDFAQRAEQVLAATQAQPATGGAAGDDGEPDAGSARAAPEIPTSASVARQATETDAIRLNRVNLIGVFGTPDARRALVRTSNGRMVRVSVGDRLDGGRVTAIGEDELRYSKNGRDEVLRIGG